MDEVTSFVEVLVEDAVFLAYRGRRRCGSSYEVSAEEELRVLFRTGALPTRLSVASALEVEAEAVEEEESVTAGDEGAAAASVKGDGVEEVTVPLLATASGRKKAAARPVRSIRRTVDDAGTRGRGVAPSQGATRVTSRANMTGRTSYLFPVTTRGRNTHGGVRIVRRRPAMSSGPDAQVNDTGARRDKRDPVTVSVPCSLTNAPSHS